MTLPLVTCIIPVFNGERYLRETLDSVRAQTYGNVETIVVDDGSTDQSARLAEQCGATVLRQENSGHAAARNRGIGSAQGEFIAFVDADDLWEPRKLELQMRCFDERPELGLVFTHLENFWSPDADISQKPADDAFVPLPGYTSVTMLSRRSAFDTVGLLDTSLQHGNDRDWFCRAAEHGVAMRMMSDVLVRRRLHSSNRSASLGDNSRAEYLRILKASLDRRRATGAVQQYPFRGTGSE